MQTLLGYLDLNQLRLTNVAILGEEPISIHSSEPCKVHLGLYRPMNYPVTRKSQRWFIRYRVKTVNVSTLEKQKDHWQQV